MHSLDFSAILGIAMRFLHIVCAIALLGGVFALLPGATDAMMSAWRRLAILAIGGLLMSGLYNFLHKTDLPAVYHMIFGMKILLALHVFAVSLIATKANNPRRTRQLTGVAISGAIIVLLSAVLRWILLK